MKVLGPSDFLLRPVFLRGLSGLFHLVLLLVLFISWLCRKFKIDGRESSGRSNRKTRFFYYRQTLFCSLGMSLFNLVLCLLNCFYWYGNGWSDDGIVTLLDLVLRTLAWLAFSLYLRTQRSNSGEPKLPLSLRIWWGSYFLLSCCLLVIDLLLKKRDHSLPVHLLVSDIVSAVAGILFCYVGFMGKKEGEDTLLQEPLLNGTTKPRRGDTVAPRSKAGVFSILTFSWMGHLINFGYKKTLDLEDVPPVDGIDGVKGAFPIFRNKLESYGGRGSQITTIKLVKALLFTTRKEVLISGILCVVNSLAAFVGPYLIDTLVQYLYGRREFKNEGYVLVSAFFIAKLVEGLSQRHGFFMLQQAGIRARAVLVALIYNKGLTISCQSKQGHTTGEIINFMAIDAQRIGDFGWYIHDPWVVILEVVIASVILYKNLGIASIAALAATILVMLANLPLARFQEKSQENLMKSKDERMKAMSEILRNMKILKLQAWEMKFLSKIFDLRSVEAGWLKKFLYNLAVITFIFWIAPTVISAITFGTCLLVGIPLESGKILSAIATLRILQLPIYKLPDTIAVIAQTKTSLDRMASFLSHKDLKPDAMEKLPRESSETAIEIVAGNFTWDTSSPTLTLKDININVSHGMSVAVCGTVGSGKSSLLSCILGELTKISGSLKLGGTKAYVAQSPWIQSGKIEDNILFGKEMDRERYQMVLEACSLKKDLEILPFGDQTIIGERGINLSGGQKQRVQIARALYQDADIYLFDDPFSAVDAHTGSHLFKECLLGILSQKTVVYVTHQIEFLPAADLILVMKDGMITQAGKYDDILSLGSNFMELVGAHREALSALNLKNSCTNVENDLGRNQMCSKKVDDDKADIIVEKKAQLVQEEEREKGVVGLPVYWKYITTAYKGALVPFILLSQILFQVFQIGSNYWMAVATPVSKDVAPPVGGLTLITVYVAFAVASALSILFRSLLLATAAYKTATILFNRMHFCIFRAPMSFFDSTPSGRILNRASTDQSAVDFSIPNQVGALAFSLITLMGIIAVMSQVAWQVFIVFIPVIATSVWLQRLYIPSARELARLSGVCKAPVIQHFAETILGSTTIRSFGQEVRFMETSMDLIDGHNRPDFYSFAGMEWLGFRLDMLSSLTFAFSLLFLILAPPGAIDPSVAGLVVTYGLNLNVIQSRVIWNLCNMENKIISVERILQYTSIPSEPPLVIETNRPHSQWPLHGEVALQDLQVRYAPQMPLVLRGLTCTFQGGMKTGIVGRTGSGKSTLIQTIFRIVEPAGGQILIDGVNICSIGLHDLRSRLSIIPQEPTMFQGTVRGNLDPLEEYTDEQIWEALDKCQLGDEVRKKEDKLDSPVVENGENWSMGQRQLVCLGRVLLKKSKVLVLDEATASVDTATDNIVQQTLKQHFFNCTVLTIAHRVTSVIDSDMVLLLDQGLIKEYDSPTRLLKNKSSSFAKLVEEYSTRSSSSSATPPNV
ncbi:Xenobiotic-transporting ATPase [Bertholletia excelsa]